MFATVAKADRTVIQFPVDVFVILDILVLNVTKVLYNLSFDLDDLCFKNVRMVNGVKTVMNIVIVETEENVILRLVRVDVLTIGLVLNVNFLVPR